MRKNTPVWFVTTLTALSAFCVYTCMYAYRKPFTAAGFDGNKLFGLEYKIWLIIAQTIGYTISKFLGIGFIGSLKNDKRAQSILKLITIGWLALLFFAIFPPPYNLIFLILNGLPLGVIYGLVFSYLEGRKSTELLGAILSVSYIFASGFSQSIGKFVLLNWHVSEWWMPWVTGLLFFPPLIFFTWLLDKTPSPTSLDILHRTKRLPMTQRERKLFIKKFFPGLVMLIIAYTMLTILRDYRSNFASNIWTELGYKNDTTVFTTSELPASIVVLVIMGLLVLVKNNIHALVLNHVLIIAGFFITIVSTICFKNGMISPFWWMTLSGIGLYMGYVPFNCMLFERLIASFKYVSNAGFIIYVADSFGYLGSNGILLFKNFGSVTISWTSYFVNMLFFISLFGIFLVFCSALYFQREYRNLQTSLKLQIKHA